MPTKSPAKANKAQRSRFIKAAREAGASEDERELDENLRRITKPKVKDAKEPDHS